MRALEEVVTSGSRPLRGRLELHRRHDGPSACGPGASTSRRWAITCSTAARSARRFPHCLDHGIGVMGYGSLGHGLLTGAFTASTAFLDPARDWRVQRRGVRPAHLPRRQFPRRTSAVVDRLAPRGGRAARGAPEPDRARVGARPPRDQHRPGGAPARPRRWTPTTPALSSTSPRPSAPRSTPSSPGAAWQAVGVHAAAPGHGGVGRGDPGRRSAGSRMSRFTPRCESSHRQPGGPARRRLPRHKRRRASPGARPLRGREPGRGARLCSPLRASALARSAPRPALDSLREALQTADAPIYLTSHEIARAVVGFDFHRGCVALGERGVEPSLEVLIDRPGPRLMLALEDVSNPDNVGGVFRNARAFGADAILLSAGCADPLYRKAIRTSICARPVTPFAHAPDWAGALARLQQGRLHPRRSPLTHPRSTSPASARARLPRASPFSSAPRAPA